MFEREIKADVIESKIEKIKDSLNSIEETLPDRLEELTESRLIQNAVYKEVEFAIEQVLDICSLINAGLRLGMPETEDNILDNLESRKVFGNSSIQLIREMKKFRSILVHKYGDINDKKAYNEIKKGLKDFELIIKEIEKFLKKKK
ncbi:MAG: DUF86 domain-containing protein [Nanoarchaeota archaeon]|nr:DUF86 domain-containing protein [Nanoarchaeota archaeon]